jgi:ABC-type multidrug transport system fused ATPase/permease subunit
LNLLAEIWSVLTPPQRRWALWAQLLSIVMAFSTVAGIASIAPFFSVLGNPQLIDHAGPLHWLYMHFGFSSKRSFEVALGMAFMGLVFIANLINVLGSFAMTKLALWIGADLQSVLLGEYLGRPFAFHAGTHSAILANNILQETARATNDVLQNVFFLVTNIATGAFILVSVMLLNPAIATLMIMALAGGYVLIYLAVRNHILRAGKVQSQFFAEQTKLVDEALGAIKEIHILRIQNFFRLAFDRSTKALARSAAHIEMIAKSPRHIMECVAVGGLVLLALLAGGREEGIAPWLGQLTFLGFAAYRLLPTLQQGFSSIVKIRSGRPGFTAIAPDLRRARVGKFDRPDPDAAWAEHPCREIRLSEISFHYGPDRPAAVSGVTLRIPARAAVGIVGANGSGKTTLVDLISGLLVPAAGRIEIDGITLDEANRADWQSRIAYVPQDIFLLDTTIEQNVALGVPAAQIDKGRLIEAARLAQLDKFVDTLPGGYGHRVGEKGVRLSGGQRQRIGIARALYTDASVLIMDEATSAQDGLSEQEIMSTLLRLRGSYTIILIAHRLSSVRACDVIFEFARGKVTASGTYGELLKDSETFRRLADVL